MGLPSTDGGVAGMLATATETNAKRRSRAASVVW
jgi:hypothetical protein